MKPLPTLAIDLRKASLERASTTPGGTVDIIDQIGKKIAVAWPDTDGHYNTAGEIVDRCNAYPELVRRLRFHAILETQKSAQARVEYDGFRCLCCGSTWKLRHPETHAHGCILKDTNNDSNK